VPGTWLLPPTIGFLWTPPWWGWGDGGYLWHGGYWGSHVGFYGGINYGYGYSGVGYEGGYWDHNQFFYNREVNNIGNANVRNVYSRTVTGGGTVNRVSFNGGANGIAAQPTAQEQAAIRERHIQATALQTQHINAARSNQALLATTNQGQPPITATSRAGHFTTTTGTAPALGTASSPNVQSNTRTSRTMGIAPTTVGRSAPNNGGQGNSRTVGQAGPKNVGQVQGNARSTGNAPSLGATSSPNVRSNTHTSPTMGTAPTTLGRSAPNNGGQGNAGNVGQAPPRNVGQAPPRNVGLAAQRNVGQGGANAIHPTATQGNTRPIANQRVVAPNVPPTGKGAPARGQEQPKG
jgi:hypothetical protein